MADVSHPAPSVKDPARVEAWSGIDWILELVVVFAICYLAQPLLQSWLGPPVGFSASIYWIPVLLLSVHYGLISGLLAVATATALFMLEGIPVARLNEAIVAYSLRVWSEPLAWLVAATLFGSFRSRQRDLLNTLRAQLRSEVNTAEIVSERYNILRRRVEGLERALAVGETPVLRRAGLLLADIAEADAQTAVDQIYALLRAATSGGEIVLSLPVEGRRRYARHSDGPILPPNLEGPGPAASFAIADSVGRTLLLADLRKVDPEKFHPQDRSHMQQLCERIGRVLEQRGMVDIASLVTSRARR